MNLGAVVLPLLNPMVPAPPSWLVIPRAVRFGETDPAGVVHFHHLLRWCHEAYEESLSTFGVPAEDVFSSPRAALPIIHCQAQYYRPMRHGDSLLIHLGCQMVDLTGFEVHYGFHCNQQMVATGLTRHLCIHPSTRKRQVLPAAIKRWLDAAILHQGGPPIGAIPQT